MPTNGDGAVGGHREACAACKHQRRKCFPDCPLAPYFPADQAAHFNAVQSLFGVSNFMKRFNEVPPESRNLFVQTMISEALLRRDHPVVGCYATINSLRQELQQFSILRQEQLSLRQELREKNAIIARQKQEISWLLQQLEHSQQQQQQLLQQQLQEQQVPFLSNFGRQMMQQSIMQQPQQQAFGAQMMQPQQQQQQQQNAAGQVMQQQQLQLATGPLFGNGVGSSHFMNQA